MGELIQYKASQDLNLNENLELTRFNNEISERNQSEQGYEYETRVGEWDDVYGNVGALSFAHGEANTFEETSDSAEHGEGMHTDDILKSYMDNVSAQQNDIKESIRASEERTSRSFDRLRELIETQITQLASLVQKQGEQLTKASEQQEARLTKMNEAQEKRFNEALAEVRTDFKETKEKVESMQQTTKWNTWGLYIGIAAMVVTMIIGIVTLVVNLK